MKKRIFAVVSAILCFASLLSCVGCAADDTLEFGSDSGTYGSDTNLATDMNIENITEKSTAKDTTKPTTKPTASQQTKPTYVPGVTKADKVLSAKTYTFANMSATEQSLFKFVGRVKPCSSGLIFDNSCATLEFQGFMTGDVVVEIESKKNAGYGQSYFTVYIDGKRSETRFKVGSNSTQKLTVASFTGNYFHTIKIVKQTEFKWSLATIKSLSFKGYLTEAPEKAKYYVEFLGDSLTAAYGNIGSTKVNNDIADSPDYQDGTKSYAYLFAESVGADYSILARSAAGISQCWSNSPMIDYYKAYSKNRSSEAFNPKNERKPNLIVIHLGANDYNVGGSNKTNFVSKGKDLINYLRDSYGTNIPIIWAYDPNEGFPAKVKEIMNSFGGESAGYYTLSLGWSEKGAGGHPSANEHAKHANLLKNLVDNKKLLK